LCPSCNTSLDPEYVFCPECGTPVPSETEAAAAPEPEASNYSEPESQGFQEPEPAPEPTSDPEPAQDEPSGPEPEPETAEAAPEYLPMPIQETARATARFRLVRLARGGGSPTTHVLPASGLVVGRDSADLSFPDDLTVSPRHIAVKPGANGVDAEDLGSLNGVFVRIPGPYQLDDADVFVCGDSVFRYSGEAGRMLPADYRQFAAPNEKPILATITRILGDGRDGDVHALRQLPFVIGREDGDLRLGGDRFMSRRHASIDKSPDGRLVLVDLGSRNGTYIRRRGVLTLNDGDILLIGRQLLRIEAVS
jgi:pSer/pThr/pTyr-binding forkhead associated (FHA) protein